MFTKTLRPLVFLSIFIVASCISTGRKIDQLAADKIEKGKTTRAEVISLVGSPDRIVVRGGGDTTFLYTHKRVTAKPETFIPIVGAFVGGANVQTQGFMVRFGSDGVVKDIISTRGSIEVSKGLATGDKVATPDLDLGKRPK